jgi:hypothetical protein
MWLMTFPRSFRDASAFPKVTPEKKWAAYYNVMILLLPVLTADCTYQI